MQSTDRLTDLFISHVGDALCRRPSPPFPAPAIQEEVIEKTIALGQLEEMIEQGKLELKLIDKYHETRMWEVVDQMNEGRTDLDELDDYMDPINPVESGQSEKASS